MIRFLASKREQELLIFGYTRMNSACTIPEVLNHKCLAFYNENVHMIFQENALKEFLKMENRTANYSKTFKIMGFIFWCSICPNGWQSTQRGKVLFYLECKSAPANVSTVSIICKMYCPQTQTKFQRTNTIRVTSNAGLFCQWHPNSLYLRDCVHKNELEFICNVEILHIEYKHGNEYHKNAIILQPKCNTNWTIDTQKLISFKGQFGPMMDNNNWRLYLIFEKRQFQAKSGCYDLMIELCQWPKNIAEIQAICDTQILDETSQSSEIFRQCTRIWRFTPMQNRHRISLNHISDFLHMQSLSFVVSIQIKDTSNKVTNTLTWNKKWEMFKQHFSEQ